MFLLRGWPRMTKNDEDEDEDEFVLKIWRIN